MEPSKTAVTHLYVVRIWREGETRPGEPVAWRAWVQDPRSGQRWGFADFEGMLNFLRTRVQGEEGVRRET